MHPVIDDPTVVSVLLQSLPDADPAAVVAEWCQAEWPSSLRTLTVYKNVDGPGVVLYAQLDSPDRPAGFEKWEQYRHYRSTPPLSGQKAEFFALNTFDSPDEQTTLAWIDAVQVLENAAGVPEGIVSGHAHVKADGTGLLNWSGWTSSRAHADFAASGVLQRAFAELAPPGPPGPVNGGFRVHTVLGA